MSIQLSPRDREVLQRYVSRQPRLTRRQKAAVLLAAAEGRPVETIARDLHISIDEAAHLVVAYTQGGLPAVGLLEANPPRERTLRTDDSPHQSREAPSSGRITTGTMPTCPDTPVAGRRPDAGFEREEAAYAQRKFELLRFAEGRYIVFVGGEMAGPVAMYGEALRAGYQRFGRGPLYIKQVLAEESVDQVSRDITPCRR